MEFASFLYLIDMKRTIFILTCLLSLQGMALQTVNAVIGDKGWKTVCAMLPQPTEKEKIAGHLQYVENYLRAHCPGGLDETQYANRLHLLDALHAYSTAGKFPANEDYPGERRPHFIDNSGNICAVGYLVEVSAGREMAECINAQYSYSFISEMHDVRLAEWMHVNGLTAEECAMIQPEYYWSGGPGLKEKPVDSLVPVVSRSLRYTGKPDSCVITFTITDKGKFENEKVKSGSQSLGNAVLPTMRGLEYMAQWSHGMGDPAQTSSSNIELTFYHGIAPPPVPADVYKYDDVKTKNAMRSDDTTKMRLTGRLHWKDFIGYGLPNVNVNAYDNTGKWLGTTTTEDNGNFNFSIAKGDYKSIRLEFAQYGMKKAIVTGIPAENADVSVAIQGEETYDRPPCNDFFCRTKFYLAAPPVPDPK